MVSRLTATGLRGTAPLFEKLRDETCLHECLFRFSFLSSRYRIVLLLFLPFGPPIPLILSPSVVFEENGVHPLLRRFSFSRIHRLTVFPPLSRALNPLDHLPRRWKVCWFARWPVVSTPLHMVTYHQSTPSHTICSSPGPYGYSWPISNVFRGHRADTSDGIPRRRGYRSAT